ncbi:MAG: hypothetical protein V1724_09335 [Chloroflexota bacterium]
MYGTWDSPADGVQLRGGSILDLRRAGDTEPGVPTCRDGEPWLELRCGPGNIFESRPVRVVSHRESAVSVQCADGAIVHLDLEEGTVRKEVGSRFFQYLGTIEEGNAGGGYI